MPTPTCKDCIHAKFTDRTPTGRIRDKPGECTYVVPLPVVPMCQPLPTPGYTWRRSIWVTTKADNCLCFEAAK